MASEAKLTQGSIAGHLLWQTLPMVIGISCLMSVGIIDAYFIGQLGSDPLAAISFIFPVTVALSSLGIGILVGINSVLARALGNQEDETARNKAAVGITFSFAVGVGVGVLLLLASKPLFSLLNAPSSLLPLIDDYMTPFAIGFPIMLTSQGVVGVLRAQGAATRSSLLLIAIAATNWILDPLLIAGWGPFPAYGVAGAAYASVGAFIVSAGLGFYFVARSHIVPRWRGLSAKTWREAGKQIFRVGGPAALSNSVNPAGLSILTGLIANFGTDAVAGFGAAGRVQSFVVVPLLALSSSIGAICGQNWGANKRERSWRALKQSSLFSIVYGLVVASLLAIFGEEVGALFSDTPSVIEAINEYLLISSWGYMGYGVLIATNGALNSVDQAAKAMLLSIARVVLVMIPVAYLGTHLAGEVEWVYIAELAANIIGGGGALLIGHLLLFRASRSSN